MAGGRTGLRFAAVAAAGAVALSGCSEFGTGDEDRQVDDEPWGGRAEWAIAEGESPTPESTTLELAVRAVDCTSGVTPPIEDSQVCYEDDRLVIQVTVEQVTGDQTCPGNPAIYFTLDLDEPLGDRALIDEICLSEPESEHSYCWDDGVRWDGGAE